MKGFGLQKGAVAITSAHDSHNALVVGTNDKDMVVALEALATMQGGLVVVGMVKSQLLLRYRLAG